MTTVAIAARTPPKHILVNGHRIHGRSVQQAGWGFGAATTGAYIISALYVLLVQVRYGSVWLKPGWDGLINQPWWDPTRHDIRDVYEGVLATLLARSLMANWKKKDRKRVGPFRIATGPLLVFFAALVPVVGGAWFLNVGGPYLWHHAFHHYVITAPHAATSWMPAWLSTFLSTWNWQPALLGVLTGLVVHPLYAPVGDTIQLYFVEKAVARARATGRTPLWVKWPIAPPVVRERFSWIMEANEAIEKHGTWTNIVIPTVSVFFGLLAIYGGFIRLWFAKHGVPGHMF